jgi:hypothetical protein
MKNDNEIFGLTLEEREEIFSKIGKELEETLRGLLADCFGLADQFLRHGSQELAFDAVQWCLDYSEPGDLVEFYNDCGDERHDREDAEDRDLAYEIYEKLALALGIPETPKTEQEHWDDDFAKEITENLIEARLDLFRPEFQAARAAFILLLSSEQQARIEDWDREQERDRVVSEIHRDAGDSLRELVSRLSEAAPEALWLNKERRHYSVAEIVQEELAKLLEKSSQEWN